jgi:hypothetical protein
MAENQKCLTIFSGVPYKFYLNSLWDTWSYPLKGLCKLSFKDQYSRKSELPKNIQWKFPILNVHKICNMIRVKYGKSIYDPV